MLIALAVFLSGAAGLVYEVVWAKQLALVLGGTAKAQTAVLALFLGGLAAGNSFFGPRADRTARPLRLYGLLELAIGLFGAATPFLFRLLESKPSAVLIVLPPAFLMGGTMPLLTRWAARSLDSLRPELGRLYGINSAGAVLGALGAGFILIPIFGLDIPLLIAGAGNFAAAAAALSLKEEPSVPKTETTPQNPKRRVLFAVFAAGIASLFYQTAWIRLFALSLGGSAYSFSLIVGAFIAGISLGGFWVSKSRGTDPVRGFLLSQIGTIAAVALGAFFYERLPYYSLIIQSSLPKNEAAFFIFSAARFALCFAAIVPAAFFMGAQLPWAARAATDSQESIGAGVGAVFSWNTAGNVLGAAAAGLWLLPLLGLRGVFVCAAALNALAAVSIEPRSRVALAAAALFAAFGPSFNQHALSSGAYRLHAPEGLRYADFIREHRNEKILFYRDDREATVAVTESPNGIRYLKVNGKSDASSGEDMATQSLLAHIPLFLQPKAKSVLIVGFGSGVTAGAALSHPVESVESVEISQAVIEAEPFFRGVNENPLADPRHHLKIGDAQIALRRAGPSFDAIISEPSNPWIAGVGNLFSAEFYAAAKSRLNPGGVMAQWFHSYEMSDEVLSLVLRGFTTAFPHVSAWELGPGDILLVGSLSPHGRNFRSLDAAWKDRPKARRLLSRFRAESAAALLSLESHSDRAVRESAGPGPINTNRMPSLEFLAPKALFFDQDSRLLDGTDERLDSRRAGELLLPRYLGSKGLDDRTLAALTAFHERIQSRVFPRLLAEQRRRSERKDIQ